MQHLLKKHFNLITYALREAFISLVPFLIVSSITTLILAALKLIYGANNLNLGFGVSFLQAALPLFVLITFSYQLAKLKHIDSAMAITLSLCSFITLHPFDLTINAHPSFINSLSLYALVIPIVMVYFLGYFINLTRRLSPNYSALDEGLRMMYLHAPSFLLSFIVGIGLFVAINKVLNITHIESLISTASQTLPPMLMLYIRTFFSHVMTFAGVHGTNIFDLMVDPTYLSQTIQPHLSAKNVIDLFVIFGGIGACLALAIAILLNAKDQHALKITKIALPFLVFNISEIIFYGLPVVLNKRLFIPFFLVPLINLCIILIMLNQQWLAFVTTDVPWTTPIFLNAYLATGGQWSAVLVQACLLVIDVVVYSFFARAYINTQCSSQHLTLLTSKLNITSNIQTKRSVKFFEAQSDLINAHLDTHDVIKQIVDNDLTLHYQPIINAKTGECYAYEALLRLKLKDGTIKPPTFLLFLEKAGLSTVIDIWGARQLRADILSWQADGINPTINFNIHPDTFSDEYSMDQIMTELAGFNVQFEVIERAFIHKETAEKQLSNLSKQHFKLAIDDFGTGYSTFDGLNTLNPDTIKIDKALLDATSNEKGYKIYYHACQLCNSLGYAVVAEGVETAEQYEMVKDMGVHYAQGWYFSKALPKSDAILFCKKQKINL
jgi:EAL domain-containing protein (putative c-di-GMP-specific phosphodiesterase class I)/cellobiose-specific phosphotransferase system component IIC